MLAKKGQELVVMLSQGFREVPMKPQCPISFLNIGGSAVSLELRSSQAVDCIILLPESKKPIRKTFYSSDPKTYEMTTGNSAVTLEAYIFDLRITFKTIPSSMKSTKGMINQTEGI